MFHTRKQLRVYVVDDEQVIAQTLAMILSSQGFESKSFTSPADALEAVRTAPPDLLISDIVMPELNGVELAIKVKERHPACRGPADFRPGAHDRSPRGGAKSGLRF